jgi:hypothetical protein
VSRGAAVNGEAVGTHEHPEIRSTDGVTTRRSWRPRVEFTFLTHFWHSS